jgi:hypothetical protein
MGSRINGYIFVCILLVAVFLRVVAVAVAVAVVVVMVAAAVVAVVTAAVAAVALAVMTAVVAAVAVAVVVLMAIVVGSPQEEVTSPPIEVQNVLIAMIKSKHIESVQRSQLLTVKILLLVIPHPIAQQVQRHVSPFT